jgi:hypothetical protein
MTKLPCRRTVPFGFSMMFVVVKHFINEAVSPIYLKRLFQTFE